MIDTEKTCPVCGFSNPVAGERCRACGARQDSLTPAYTAEEAYARRYQQDGFAWKWVGVACGVHLGTQALVLVILPLLISAYDPHGLPGLMISAAVWFFGGIAVGYISPGKTFVEPAAGALVAVPPTIAYLILTTPKGFQPSLMAYIVFSLIGVMVALVGAFIGERIQMGSSRTV